MQIFSSKNFKNGWFIGNFEPALLKTNNFEVGIKSYKAGELHALHTHKIATEYNYLVSGKIIIQNQIIESDQIFVIYPWELSDIQFLEDSTILVVKIPSDNQDKYNLKEIV